MSDSWEQVRRALLAEAQGKPLPPVVSKRTLFGIPSDIERTMERVARESTQQAARRRADAEGEGDDDPSDRA